MLIEKFMTLFLEVIVRDMKRNKPGLLRDLSDGLPASADDGADHLRLDEDPEREVDRPLQEENEIDFVNR